MDNTKKFTFKNPILVKLNYNADCGCNLTWPKYNGVVSHLGQNYNDDIWFLQSWLLNLLWVHVLIKIVPNSIANLAKKKKFNSKCYNIFFINSNILRN